MPKMARSDSRPPLILRLLQPIYALRLLRSDIADPQKSLLLCDVHHRACDAIAQSRLPGGMAAERGE